MTMESSLLLAIIWSPFDEKSRQLTRSVFSLNTLDTRNERKTSSVSFIFGAPRLRGRGRSCAVDILGWGGPREIYRANQKF